MTTVGPFDQVKGATHTLCRCVFECIRCGPRPVLFAAAEHNQHLHARTRPAHHPHSHHMSAADRVTRASNEVCASESIVAIHLSLVAAHAHALGTDFAARVLHDTHTSPIMATRSRHRHHGAVADAHQHGCAPS